MKLELYDNIILNKEIEDFNERGIHKDCLGTIAKLGADKSLVIFYNRSDVGDYAFAWVKNEHLDFFGKMDETLMKEFAERITKLDPAKKLGFENSNLQEYDAVELIVERAEYTKRGVYKGMVGTILDPEKLDGNWLVYFSDETGADTIGIPVKEKDLKLVHRTDK